MAEKDKYADEMLSDDELDNVVGGDVLGTALDSHLLYDYGLVSDWHEGGLFIHWESYSAEIDAGWAKAGITCVTEFACNNKYFAGSTEISRNEAIKILKSKFYRKHYTYSTDDGIGNP